MYDDVGQPLAERASAITETRDGRRELAESTSNGEIVRLAHRHGTAAPLNATLARHARGAAQDGLGPGRYSTVQLAALVGQLRPDQEASR